MTHFLPWIQRVALMMPMPLHGQVSPYTPLTPQNTPLVAPSPSQEGLEDIARLEVVAAMEEMRKIRPILFWLNMDKTYTLKE